MDKFVIDPSILAIFVLVTCVVCIYMVFFFGRRLQTTAYLRDSLIEGARQQELKILLREIQERRLEGPLDATQPPPEDYGPTARLWEPNHYGRPKSGNDWDVLGEETEQQRHRREMREAEEARRAEAHRTWESDERKRYEALRKSAEAEALERAKKKIPSSIDMSLLGGGWAFLLEFSTVIVIIFTLLILGILKTLEGKEISTILAAIAGYVLGKATSGSRQQEKPPMKPLPGSGKSSDAQDA